MATDKLINGHYSFDGYTTTRIHFDNVTKLWKMELLSDPSIYATTELVPVEYPFGSHIWDVEAPAYKGDLEMNLNSCDDFDSFGCNDGGCIPIEERFFKSPFDRNCAIISSPLLPLRCNGNNDCNDASDEVNCDKISVLKTYQRGFPPPPKDDDMLANIFLSVDITTVLNLDEVESIMTLQYTLTLKWMDRRVTFRNLKSETFLNTIDTLDASKMWYPRLLFYNTADKEDTQVC